MTKIGLSNGMVAVVDDSDAALVAPFNWHLMETGKIKKRRYAIARIARKTVLMHRLILKPPGHLQVDHINGDGLDNRRENMRICTGAQNALNRGWQANNKLGLKGVKFCPDNSFHPYIARAGSKQNRVYLGAFKTASEAHAAYIAWAKPRHGEFFRAE